jgi:hypothetical protein
LAHVEHPIQAMAIAYLAALSFTIGVTAVSEVVAAASSGGSDGAHCRVSLTRLIAGAPPAVVPASCWRIGPLGLGMTEAELDRTMGAPAQSTVVADDLRPDVKYRVEIYASPSTWQTDLARPSASSLRLRFVEVSLRDGRVVRIDNAPPSVIHGRTCKAVAHPPEIDVEADVRDFAPFQTFAGLRVGADVHVLARWFGRAPSANASHDWYAYAPAPIMIDAEPETNRITGFAIGFNWDTVTVGAPVRMTVSRDPATCRITGISFGPTSPTSPP